MSSRYPGGVITKTPVVPAGPYETGAAPGIWTLDQQLQAQKAGIWPIAGNPVPVIEDMFSTYLYTANGSPLTINNGIDLAGKGGLVWVKNRTGVASNTLTDSVTGVGKRLFSDTTDAQLASGGATNFTSTGFDPGATGGSDSYATWTFREQPKFFDIVTYTGNGSSPRAIAHNLGSTPGCMIVKNTGVAGAWFVYHRSANAPGYTAAESYLNLNNTNAVTDNAFIWGNTAPTSTQFTVSTQLNQSANTYVAYLFAHNAGGFGLTGTDNVISCGSTTGGGGTVNLGYEPQWLLMKKTNGAQNWFLMDNMRGLNANQGDQALSPNLSSAEPTASSNINITSTGFINVGLGSISDTYIYIAIRRGPMKVPTSGTSVFSPIYSAAAANTVLTTSFPVDLQIPAYTGGTIGRFVVDRLRGVVTTAVDAATSPWMKTNATDAETTGFNITRAWDNTGYQIPQYLGGATTVYFNFRRAPGFFDEVCWTGDGTTGRNINHNLSVTPELIIVKSRNGAGTNWFVNATPFTNWANGYPCGFLNLTDAISGNTTTGIKNVTSSVFEVNHPNTNTSNSSFNLYVAYLFATVAGVSKVGSYSGTGTTQVINCGFTAGARFVLIKRTDSTGDWYVWDSARGIVAGNDPYLLLNSTAAEVTGTDYVDTAASGFEISSTAPAAINANGGSFIFLAIA